MARAKSTDPVPLKVTIQLPAELVQALDTHAATERRSRSNAAALLLERALAEIARVRTAG